MADLISVIIPTYNHAHYLPYAIQSVLGQGYINWEAIVIDDGSTDNTASVISKFADPRIRYIYQENKGLAATRNTGIEAAQGKYLAFLDADDEWEPEFLERCITVIKETKDSGVAGVYTSCKHIDQNGDLLPQPGNAVVAPEELYECLLEGGFFPPHVMFVKKNIVKTLGMFDVTLRSAEDWDLWLRISKQYTLIGIAEPLARYRLSPGSMSTNAARMHENRMAVLTKNFSAPEGDLTTWPEEKRLAYGFAYRLAAFEYIQQGQINEGWHFLTKAIFTWPALLERLDTFYELVCGDQPKGYRGLADIPEEGYITEMFIRLDTLFQAASPTLKSMSQTAYSNAYLALAMLNDRADHWSTARRYLLQAIKANLQLFISPSILRRLLKLYAGQRLFYFFRRLLVSDNQQSKQKSILPTP